MDGKILKLQAAAHKMENIIESMAIELEIVKQKNNKTIYDYEWLIVLFSINLFKAVFTFYIQITTDC